MCDQKKVRITLTQYNDTTCTVPALLYDSFAADGSCVIMPPVTKVLIPRSYPANPLNPSFLIQGVCATNPLAIPKFVVDNPGFAFMGSPRSLACPGTIHPVTGLTVTDNPFLNGLSTFLASEESMYCPESGTQLKCDHTAHPGLNPGDALYRSCFKPPGPLNLRLPKATCGVAGPYVYMSLCQAPDPNAAP